MPVPDRHQHLAGQPRHPVAVRGDARQRHPAGAVPVGAVGVGGLCRPRPSRASRCTSSPRRMRAPNSTASGCSRTRRRRRAGARAAAVIVGDSPEELTYANLNVAFRLVRSGARLIGMHRNPWWLTPDGPTLDSGAYVAGPRVRRRRARPDHRQAGAGLLLAGRRRAPPRGRVARGPAPPLRDRDGRRRRPDRRAGRPALRPARRLRADRKARPGRARGCPDSGAAGANRMPSRRRWPTSWPR